MVVLDEKIPPPPYARSGSAPPPFPCPTLTALPAHLLLKIVYMTFAGTQTERQRKTLYWLSHQLRVVNRSFYIACMHVLRSTYLLAYGSLVRAPYSSDPFPPSSASFPAGPVQTIHRETQVLDLFIALKVREDVMMDDTELHLERDESFRDLFDLMQPRSRLEDLVRYHGLREGVVHTNPPGASFSSAGPQPQLRSNNGSSSSVNRRTSLAPLPFSTISVSFSPRKAGLVVTTPSRKRTIVEVARTRDEKLEVTAKQLVKRLGVWLNDA